MDDPSEVHDAALQDQSTTRQSWADQMNMLDDEEARVELSASSEAPRDPANPEAKPAAQLTTV